ncbi:hypothetical protein LAD77_01865 [Klebsiella pneumoniae]|nr:hypothetical protein [Klebsiella pneumoniae]
MMVASGITHQVLDAVRCDVRDAAIRLENLEKMVNAVERRKKRGLNRPRNTACHLRCEACRITPLPLCEKLTIAESGACSL